MTKKTKSVISKDKDKNKNEIRKLQDRLYNQRKTLVGLMNNFEKNRDLIEETLSNTAKICERKIDLGSYFRSNTLGDCSEWYKACHLLQEAGRSHKVPPFFQNFFAVHSQSTDGASNQGRKDKVPPSTPINSLFGGTLTDKNAADIVTRRRPVTGGSVTGGSRKRRKLN